MKVLQLLLTLLLLSTATAYCAGSREMYLSTCSFYYNYAYLNCTDFVFLYCTWDQCASYSEANNQTQCQEYQTKKESSWNRCTHECCSSFKVYPQEYFSLDTCQTDINKSIFMQATIIGVSFAVLCVISIMAKKLKYLKQKIGTLCLGMQESTDCMRRLIGMIGRKYLSKYKGRAFTTQKSIPENQQTPMSISWQQADLHQNEGKVCSVCQEKGFTVQYLCGHNLHKDCLKNSIINKRCPVCDLNLTDGIKIYCEKCRESYFTCTAESLKSSLLNMPCQRCTQVHTQL